MSWPAGVRCQKCEGAKGWWTADGRWSCSGCGRKVSVTAGTIFDRSRISPQEWFPAAWYMTNQKHEVSALGLQRMLGLGAIKPNGPSCRLHQARAKCANLNSIRNIHYIQVKAAAIKKRLEKYEPIFAMGGRRRIRASSG